MKNEDKEQLGVLLMSFMDGPKLQTSLHWPAERGVDEKVSAGEEFQERKRRLVREDEMTSNLYLPHTSHVSQST